MRVKLDQLFTGKQIRLTAPQAEDASIMAKWQGDSDYLRRVDTGFKAEGCPRQTVLRKGQPFDQIIMGLLYEEWMEMQKD